MTNTQALLDRAREMCTPPTFYRLAQVLEVHQQTISRVMRHGGGIDNEAAFRLAKMLGMNPATIIAYIEEDRAPLARKEFWRSQLPRLLAATGLAATLATSSPRDSEAAAAVKPVSYTIYIMRTLVRWLRSMTSVPFPRRIAHAEQS